MDGPWQKGALLWEGPRGRAWAQSQPWAFMATALFVSVRRALEGPARRPGPDGGRAQSSGSWLGLLACTTLLSADSPRFPPSLSSQNRVGLWSLGKKPNLCVPQFPHLHPEGDITPCGVSETLGHLLAALCCEVISRATGQISRRVPGLGAVMPRRGRQASRSCLKLAGEGGGTAEAGAVLRGEGRVRAARAGFLEEGLAGGQIWAEGPAG